MISKPNRSTSYDSGKKLIAKFFDGSQICGDFYVQNRLHIFSWRALHDLKVDANLVVIESVDAVFLLKKAKKYRHHVWTNAIEIECNDDTIVKMARNSALAYI